MQSDSADQYQGQSFTNPQWSTYASDWPVDEHDPNVLPEGKLREPFPQGHRIRRDGSSTNREDVFIRNINDPADVEASRAAVEFPNGPKPASRHLPRPALLHGKSARVTPGAV